MKKGDFILYDATHNGRKVQKIGQIHDDQGAWVLCKWHYPFDHDILPYHAVMKRYCTVFTKEVADIILSTKEKE